MATASHWFTLVASLRIRADIIDLIEVERVMGLAHTSFLTKGNKRKGLTYRGDKDIWVFRTQKYDGFEDSGLFFEAAEKLLETRVSALLDIKHRLGYEIEFYISYHSDLSSGGIQVPESLIATLAKAELPLRLSVLSWGRMPDDGSSGDEGVEDEGV